MINVIIPHFVKYPLLTQKRADFELFKSIVEMLHRKEHLSPNGLQQIVNIRALINNGLSDTLKAAFPHVTPVPRPVVEPSEIPDPNWLAGFVAGEGHFIINIIKSSSCKLGFQVRLLFKITQHSRDSVLMQTIVGYLGCGLARALLSISSSRIGRFSFD